MTLSSDIPQSFVLSLVLGKFFWVYHYYQENYRYSVCLTEIVERINL